MKIKVIVVLFTNQVKLSCVTLVAFALFTSTAPFNLQLLNSYSYASRMWYAKPAINWNEALPIGNGRLGAMVFGGVAVEHISLNEQTLWSGAPRDGNNPKAQAYLPLVRKAALQGNYREADSLSRFMQGPYTESYMPMADLLITYNNITDSSGYSRELDLDSALTKVTFGKNNNYTRTAFASFPHQVIVLQQSSKTKRSVSFRASLGSKLHYKILVISNHHIVLKGKCPEHVAPAYLWKLNDNEAVKYSTSEKGEGMNFEVHVFVKNEGGKSNADSNGITVVNADAATILISAATSYNGFTRSPGLDGKEPSVDARRFIDGSSAKSFEELKQAHIKDYQPIFRRASFYLGESRNNHLPTDMRLKHMNTNTDPELVAQIAQFGRYLLIAGSRPGGQPVNLKGIWNDRLRAEYSSNWCIDHDAQMFYYAVETTNLQEMNEPFIQFITDLSVNGKKTAAVDYGMQGWCAHHNTDIWRCSNPVGNFGEGNPHWATWNMSAPWLCANLFDHYLFTGDKIYLQQEAWPVMKGAAEFCLNWLIEKDGHLVSVPSVSPENTFITGKGDTAQISSNTTSDIALIKELFTNCIETADILQTDKAFGEILKKALGKLMPYPIGSLGQLLEWQKEWRSVDPSHRHLSHMYPVFPGKEISPLKTPELSGAAKVALSLREKTNCSWGFAWKAACWARLAEADSAWQTWQYQLQYVDPESTSSQDNYGLFPNFFNSDGKDVIMNGNGCATAVLTEMILQSHTGAIELLPALPKVFRNGAVKGLCARGGFVIDFSWRDMQVSSATIFSKLGNDCVLSTSGPVRIYDETKEVAAVPGKKNMFSFKTQTGKKYVIKFLQD